MKRTLLILAIAALALPATALAKGPSAASVTGPGLGKPIKITGTEDTGSPMMNFAEQAGFFPAVFGQTPDPMLPDRPKGDLGPRYTIDYTVPASDTQANHIRQELYPYARPSPITYMAPGQEIFDSTTRGGWFQADPQLTKNLVVDGLPARPPATAAAAPRHSSSNSSFFSTGMLSWFGAVAVVLAAATGAVLYRRVHRRPAA